MVEWNLSRVPNSPSLRHSKSIEVESDGSDNGHKDGRVTVLRTFSMGIASGGTVAQGWEVDGLVRLRSIDIQTNR